MVGPDYYRIWHLIRWRKGELIHSYGSAGTWQPNIARDNLALW